MPKEGDILTIKNEIFTIGGQIIFTKGQKIVVDEVIIEKGHWSNFFNIWYEDRLQWIKIVGEYGLWSPDAFEELSKK